MRVTNITVSFLREKQPAKFEKAQPMVELSGVLEEGEDHLTAARDLMLDAAAVVYAGIGYETPAKVADALLSLGVDGTLVSGIQAKAAVKVEKVEDTTSENVPGDEKPAAEPKKRRGRPPGSKNTAPKAGTKAADVAAKAGAASTKAAEEAVPGDDPTPNISSGGEDRVDPAQDEAFTAQTLEKMFRRLLKGLDLFYSPPSADATGAADS